jgi:hypothetical protein
MVSLRRVLVVLVVLVAAATSMSTAVNAATCPPPPTAVQPFTPWSDAGYYVLTTGGSFEFDGAPTWALAGGAKIVSDNAPNGIDPASHSHALYLPAGSSATSACVTAPQILGIVRFFAKSVGVAGGQLKVEIVVKGDVYQAGIISAGSAWAPTPILASNAPAYKGAVTYQVRLTPVGSEAGFIVDDVYFDPFKMT